MNYFSMFSGIGGFELGIQKAYVDTNKGSAKRRRQANTPGNESQGEGLQPVSEKANLSPAGYAGQHSNGTPDQRQPHCVGYSEIDKYAIKIYESHFKNHKNYGDATTINPAELPDFDLLVGGFPCQAFSVAGKRAGFNDTRGTLFFEIARILKVKTPKRFVLENVKGLLSHDDGRTFKTIIATLADMGYSLEWQVLNSKDFGVPQNRQRVFIIGYFGEFSGRQIFPLGSINEAGTKELEGSTQNAHTLKAGYGNAKGGDDYVIEPSHKHGEQRVYRGVVPTMQARWGTGGNNVPYIAQRGRGKNKGGLHEVAPTLSSNDWQSNNTLGAIRRLTPVECERLQGFPDNWTAIVSDAQRYKCLGNAVTVNVIEAIIKQMYGLAKIKTHTTGS